VEGVFTHLHSVRSQIFTKFFPRCGIPDAFPGGWAEYEEYVRFLYDTRSIDEHTQLWWSVRPHLAFPTIEIRMMDGQPDVADTRAVAALAYATVARIVRAHDEGERLPDQPRRLLEENFWRAIRHGLSGEFIDLERREVVSTRTAIARLTEWVLPVAEELGAARWLEVPEANAAERQIARHGEGASMYEIYADLVEGTRVHA
jgi:glutamate---cysteine ligase / carboxylate-amine ligase